MKKLSLLVILLIFKTFNAFYDESSGVKLLTSKNFNKVVKKDNSVTLVEFFAPWCGHCKSLKPTYIKLAKQLGNLLTVAAVDCDDQDNSDLRNKYEIKGFPTIKLFYNHKVIDYNGGRTKKELTDFALENLPTEFITVLTKKNLPEFKNLDKPKVILFTEKNSIPNLYKKLSSTYFKFIRFGLVKKKELNNIAPEYKVENFPTLISIDEKNKSSIYEGEMNSEDINEYLTNLAGDMSEKDTIKKFPEISDNSCLYKYCEHLCAILFTNKNEELSKKYRNAFKEAEENRMDTFFTFVSVDGTKEIGFAKQIFGGIKELITPRIATLSIKKSAFAVYKGPPDSTEIDQFLNNVVNRKTRIKKLESHLFLKSDTEKCGDFGLTRLNSSNFDSYMKSSKVPVIVQFYTPWCKGCKETEKDWMKSAKNMEGMVSFVKVDTFQEKKLAELYKVKSWQVIKTMPNPNTEEIVLVDYLGKKSAKELINLSRDILKNRSHVNLINNYHDYKEWDFGQNDKQPKIISLSEKNDIPTIMSALSVHFKKDKISFVSISKTIEGVDKQFETSSHTGKILAMVNNEKSLKFLPFSKKIIFNHVTKWVKNIMDNNWDLEKLNTKKSLREIEYDDIKERTEKIKKEKEEKTDEEEGKNVNEKKVHPEGKDEDKSSKEKEEL